MEKNQKTIEKVLRLVEGTPFLLSNEKEVQAELSRIFTENEIPHKREVVLGPGDIVDFMLEGGIAIEVKIKVPKRSAYRQCKRYCEHESVNALILASATATGFPEEINGKPCWVASLGRGWL